MSNSPGALTHRMPQTLTRGDNDVIEAVQEHAAIVDGVRSGDRDSAVEAMRRHIERLRERSTAG